MAAYHWVYDSHHLQADCEEPGSAPEPNTRQSSMGYLYLFTRVSEPCNVSRMKLTSGAVRGAGRGRRVILTRRQHYHTHTHTCILSTINHNDNATTHTDRHTYTHILNLSTTPATLPHTHTHGHTHTYTYSIDQPHQTQKLSSSHGSLASPSEYVSTDRRLCFDAVGWAAGRASGL